VCFSNPPISMCLCVECNSSCRVFRVGQNCTFTPYMTVYLVISLPKIPYIHRIYIYILYIWFWPTLQVLHRMALELGCMRWAVGGGAAFLSLILNSCDSDATVSYYSPIPPACLLLLWLHSKPSGGKEERGFPMHLCCMVF